LAEWIGFIPVAFALLMGLFLWFGVRPHNAVIIAALFTAVTFWFFANMLRVPLPRGWLTGIL
jgi:putative tricarboxylic transport membrane protein